MGRLTFREFFHHAFGARRATAFDEHQVVRRSFFSQDFGRFIRRSDGATFFQPGFLRRVRDYRCGFADGDQFINLQTRRGFANFAMTALGFASQVPPFRRARRYDARQFPIPPTWPSAARIDSGFAL